MEQVILEQTEDQVAIFSALADPTRLRLVKLLARQKQPGALCVNALAGLLGVTQSAVSQHLRVLKSIGLVKGERLGYHIHYFINPAALERCWKLAKAALTMEEAGKDEPCESNCPVRRE